MTKYVSIWIALIALAVAPANAQQQDTFQPNDLQRESLTTLEVPGADFDIVFATRYSQALAVIDNGRQGDPLDAGLWSTRVYLVPKQGLAMSNE